MSNKVLNTKLKKQIAELVATGLSVKKTLAKLGSVVQPNTVYKEQAKDKEFAELMQDAYFAHFMNLQDQLDDLALQTASEVYPDLPFNEAAEALKRRSKVMQDKLDKLGPVLAAKLNKATKMEVSGEVNHGITVVLDNYCMPVLDVSPKLLESEWPSKE